MPPVKSPDELLPLTPPVFHLLVALSDGERHGYALMRQVADDTDGILKLGPGTLYGCLQRMLEAGLIAESDQRADPQLDDERRRYYRIATSAVVWSGQKRNAWLRRVRQHVRGGCSPRAHDCRDACANATSSAVCGRLQNLPLDDLRVSHRVQADIWSRACRHVQKSSRRRLGWRRHPGVARVCRTHRHRLCAYVRHAVDGVQTAQLDVAARIE